MRMRIAAVAAIAALSACASSSQAAATPSRDARYLAAVHGLHAEVVDGNADETLIGIARLECQTLTAGLSASTVPNILTGIAWPVAAVRGTMRAAVAVYCPSAQK